MNAETPDQACARLAAIQFGAISRGQALSLGMTTSQIDHRVSSGRWRSIHSGVYAVAGSPDSWMQRAMAANLAGGPESAISHLSAAAVHGLRESRPLLINLITPRQISAQGVRCYRAALSPLDHMRYGPLVVTNPKRTLIDLAAILDQDRLEDCLEEALFQNLTNMADLATWFPDTEARGRKGIGKLRRLLEMRDQSAAPNETTFETLLFRTLRKARLPLPERQFGVWDVAGPITRLDFAYPDVLLGVPADSYKWHGRRRTWDKDIEQRNRLLTLGWRLRPTTWTELKRTPDRFTSDIRRLLSA